MKKKGTLKITLKSDLCASSGYAYAGIVDSDVCYDDYGLPYIPARRLKGCLRDAYESLLFAKYQKDVVDIFGKPGADIKESSAIIIDNAYIENYEKLTRGIQNGRQSGKDVAQYFNTEDILERFSSVIAQTKMEKGVADTKSLRFTRTINQFSPINGEELVFNATVSFDDARVSEAMLEDLAKATRHIGLKRNRGMGDVRCAFTASDNDQTAKSDYIEIETFDNGKTKISYAVENIAPLMISAEDEEASGDYIPGQQVLGMMASRYLKMPGNSADDETFKDLFLKGKQTVFSNLYPYKKNKIYYPAPSYICRLKKSKEYVYMLEQNLGEKKEMENGNVPKNLRGKYIAIFENTKNGIDIDECEVKKEIIYHHSHRNTHTIVGKDGKEREEGILYTGEAIRAGQNFAGHIIVDDDYADVIKKLLLNDDFYFGKSRSTQYGHCRLTKYEGDVNKPKSVSFEAEKDVLVTLLSDVVLPENIFCEGKEKIENKIAEELKIQVCHTPKEHIDQTEKAETKSYMSLLVTGLITGYSGIWNLRKQPIPAIKAGSCFVFKTASEFETEKLLRIGERQNEGFGLVRVQHASDFSYENPSEEKNNASGSHAESQKEKNNVDDVVQVEKELGKLVKPIVLKHWLDRKINDIIQSKTISDVSNSAAGRFKLMLMESIANKKDTDKRFGDFAKRIESIKSDGTRKSGEKLLKLVGIKKWRLDSEKIKRINLNDLERDMRDMGFDDNDTINNLKNIIEMERNAEKQFEDFLELLKSNSRKTSEEKEKLLELVGSKWHLDNKKIKQINLNELERDMRAMGFDDNDTINNLKNIIEMERNAEKQFKDFVELLKSDSRKTSEEKEKLLGLVGSKWHLDGKKIQRINFNEKKPIEVDQLEKMGLDERDIVADMKEKWHEFIMAVIVDRKLSEKGD